MKPSRVFKLKRINRDLRKFQIKYDAKKAALEVRWKQYYEAKMRFKVDGSHKNQADLDFAIATLKHQETKFWGITSAIEMLNKQKLRVLVRSGMVENKYKLSDRPPVFVWKESNYPTLDQFQNKYAGGKALIIGGGMSTKKILPYKNKLKEKFDVVIGINSVVLDFEDVLDFHMVLDRLQLWMVNQLKWFDGNYRKDLPRVLNFKTIHNFPKDLNIIKAKRAPFNDAPDIRKLKHNGQEGLCSGVINRQGLSVGTPVTHSVHLAGFLGCNSIHIVGADFIFGDDYDHYHKGRLYRDNALECKQRNKSLIIDIEHDGKMEKTIELFWDAAEYINDALIPLCQNSGIGVFDFSTGLLRKDIRIDIDDFMRGN